MNIYVQPVDEDGKPIGESWDYITESGSVPLVEFIDDTGATHLPYESVGADTVRVSEVSIEFTMDSISPSMYYILTGRRLPIKARIAYFAREWSRKARGIFHRNT